MTRVSPAAQKAFEKLKKLGPVAIPKIINALPAADKNHMINFVEVLSELANDKNLPSFAQGLADANPKSVSGTAWALSSSQQFNPNQLLDLLTEDGISKPAVLEVLGAHKSRLNVRELRRRAYELQPSDKAALFKLVAEIADESLVPDLCNRLGGKDPMVRVHLINILARFNLPEVHQKLQEQLKDNHKMVRQAALTSLAKLDGDLNVELICSLLQDPDLDVQNKAVDIVIKLNHPETVKYLVEVLKDESEYARRSAVEVLNEIGDANSIKYLLQAVEDDDWWVRTRSADALAKIGGPRVVDAVLQLVRDEDEGIRRAAIEILNQTKDQKAVGHLIEATKDPDWWVRERAADALAAIGNKKAVPALIKMLSGPTKSLPTVVRALAKLGDHKVLDKLIPLTQRPEKEIKIEAMSALAKLSDERRADTIRAYIQKQGESSADQTVNRAAAKAMEDIDARFSTTTMAVGEQAARMAEPAKTLLIEQEDIEAAMPEIEEPEAAAVLDISTLQPGDMLEARYKYIEKIGKGAFGTVLLVEDMVVDERLILKFLNPNVSSDEEMRKRFVHELRYSRKITHKNVIRIYDFLYMGGNYAISMEYFPSHTLGAEINDGKPLSTEKALGWACDICTGMIVAHQVGIVHRDLKPANILINDQGLLKIVDFGVAAAASSGDTQLTKTGYVIGSPKYMAPEQILGKKVDVKADIYSLGVILYEMLTGTPPYTRGDHMSVMYQHVQGKAPPAHEVNTRLPSELSDIVSRAMSVDKLKRFESMDDMRGALEPFG